MPRLILRLFVFSLLLTACPKDDTGTPYEDADGDGYTADEDCDEYNPAIHPGAEEVCDGQDNDCDSEVDEGVLTTGYVDSDSDGFGDPALSTEACDLPSGYVDDATDCDDSRADVHPEAVEVCDEVDNNCDGTIDEDATTTWYQDADGDGWGTDAATTQACSPPSGYSDVATDCDDTAADIYPGAPESCDGQDNDCDTEIDEGATQQFFLDADGDGYGDPREPTSACAAPSGYVDNDADCDDDFPEVSPDAVEQCNEYDDDCDGDIDEGVTTTFYMDRDGDGYGLAAATTQACSAPSGYVSDTTDCDDRDGSVHPGADEYCDRTDNDCDGIVDEDAVDPVPLYVDGDGDGYGSGSVAATGCLGTAGYSTNPDDCDDGDRSISPGARESCDGVDNDCDGIVDPDSSYNATTWYEDADGDGYGNPDSSTRSCGAVSGYVADDSDCDDTDATVSTCWEPTYIWYDYGFGISGGAMVDVSISGDTVSPWLSIHLCDDAYISSWDDADVCTITYDLTASAGTLATSAYLDWAVDDLSYSADEGDLCGELSAAVWGDDPFTTLAEYAALEFSVDDVDTALAAELATAFGSDWTTYSPYIIGSELFFDGSSALGSQDHYGISFGLTSSMEVDTSGYLAKTDFLAGTDAYVEFYSLYLYGIF